MSELLPERTLRVCRAASRLCAQRGWTAVPEVPLPNGRRMDLLALDNDGGFTAIEVKSCARDFLTDSKWWEYRDWCDRLYFAVDLDFPQALIPEDVGLIVADEGEAAILRHPAEHKLAPARRRSCCCAMRGWRPGGCRCWRTRRGRRKCARRCGWNELTPPPRHA
ncbi:MmcB family DNA repair protein [Pseudoroseomonas wenyumeiae]